MSQCSALPTVGEICRRLGYPPHRVEYVIRARQMEPQSQAGGARVFSEEQVERIAEELRRIDARRREAKHDPN